jgi:hypothetical protein
MITKLVIYGVTNLKFSLIVFQKNGKHEQVIAYASEGLTPIQKHYHPMEGECYALIWKIMHFK